MPADNFVDRNIFVYMLDISAPAKRQRARELVYGLLQGRTGCISYPVAQEVLNVLIGRLGEPPDAVAAFLEEILRPLWQINEINATPELYSNGLRVQARYGFGFYDSLIVAAALGAGCTTFGFTRAAMWAEVAEAVVLMQARGDANLHYVDGLELFGPDMAHMLPDDLHPDAEGYPAMGRNFVEKVAATVFGRAPVLA